MKMTFDRELNVYEKEILFTKVKKAEFCNFHFSLEKKLDIKLYLPSVYDNDTLPLLYDYIKWEGLVSSPFSSKTREEWIKEINSLFRKDKELFFRLLVLASIMGNGKASNLIGTMYRVQGMKDKAFAWYKKVIYYYKDEIEDAVQGIIRMSISKQRFWFGAI